MASCCSQGAYGKVFTESAARRDARRYRRKGLNASGRWVLDLLRSRVAGMSVLEVGGGIGDVQLELLRAGAESALNVELSPAYEQIAGELISAAGAEERVERRVLDFAAEAEGLPPADVVVLNRVVCCYPDVDALVGAAAGRARSWLVLTFPRETRLVRAGFALLNLGLWLFRREFRSYVHPVARIHAAALGLRLVEERRGRLWQLAAFAR